MLSMLRSLLRKVYDRDEAVLRRLRRQGATVGRNVQIVDRSRLLYEPWYANLIEIQDGVVISAGVRLVTHDSSYANILGNLPIRYGRIVIEQNAYIGVNAIILPGVRIGESALIGAGTVVNRDIPARTIAAGNPVKVLSTLEEGLSRYREKMSGKGEDGVYYLDLGGSYRQMRERWGSETATEVLKQYARYQTSGTFDPSASN